jgi:NADPH-dependent 2,4-dienoyl-CoA reductase/sulfur reductase-like enzyme
VAVGDKTVVVGAGSVGVETAIGLKQAGKEVVVVEMAPDFDNLRRSSGAVATELLRLLEELAIPVHLSCPLEEVTDRSVICRHAASGERVEFPADTVLLAVGLRSRHEVADSLRRAAPETEVHVVGDAREVGNIATAVMSAFRAAAYI